MNKTLYYVDPGNFTPADQFRAQLNKLGDLVGQIGHGLGRQALDIPPMLDEVTSRLEQLSAEGNDLRGEAAQLAALSADLRHKAQLFLRQVGGVAVLEQARAARQIDLARPIDPAQWWWFLDRLIADQRRATLRRLAQRLVIAAASLAVLYVVYVKFLAPDPAVSASYTYQQYAEQFAASGNLNSALQEIERAIAARPDNPDLLVFKGMLQQLMGQGQAAQETWSAAEAMLGKKTDLLTLRAQKWLLLQQSQAALADAQAIVQMDPASAVGYLLLGQANEQLGQDMDAIAAYETAGNLANASNQPQIAVMARMQMGMLQQRFILPTAKPTVQP